MLWYFLKYSENGILFQCLWLRFISMKVVKHNLSDSIVSGYCLPAEGHHLSHLKTTQRLLWRWYCWSFKLSAVPYWVIFAYHSKPTVLYARSALGSYMELWVLLLIGECWVCVAASKAFVLLVSWLVSILSLYCLRAIVTLYQCSVCRLLFSWITPQSLSMMGSEKLFSFKLSNSLWT